MYILFALVNFKQTIQTIKSGHQISAIKIHGQTEFISTLYVKEVKPLLMPSNYNIIWYTKKFYICQPKQNI